MNDRALAALFVLVVWWLSTGLVLKMVWLGRSTFRIAAFTALGLVGVGGVVWSSRYATPGAAYVAFSAALAVWAWHELMFLLGIVVGPRKIACPPDARGWLRFRCATAALIHHEVALAVTLVGLVAMTWRAPNQVGTGTFLVLWIMRLSAKFNVFLGVRNLTEQFVPDHLRYMLSYFRRARMNWLMPLSVGGASWAAVRLFRVSRAVDASAFMAVGYTLVATLLALAVLEHVFLSVPVPDAMLWQWATRVKNRAARTGQAPIPRLPAGAP